MPHEEDAVKDTVEMRMEMTLAWSPGSKPTLRKCRVTLYSPSGESFWGEAEAERDPVAMDLAAREATSKAVASFNGG